MIPPLKKIFDSKSHSSNVLMLTFGTSVGQMAIIASAPIITRLYGPEDVGLFAVFGAALGIITVISSLHYELAIPLPTEDAMGYGCVLS